MSRIHSNISIFVPHIGCPNKCSFCNQIHITGAHKAPSESDVTAAVETAVKSPHYDSKTTEIAFFGGSFTAIDKSYMLSLLSAAYGFVKNNTVCGIRVSTRPDAISREILDTLKSYGVTSIELGAQSLCDEVLWANNRGHSAQDVKTASALIKEYGFSLGLQMMTGLYADTDERAQKTAEEIIKLKPQTVRIYPTIVLKDTYLEKLYKDKKYTPQSLDSAVNLCSKLYKRFEDNGIKVIRLGLHSIEEDSYVAGPWHPAFSELCQSKLFYHKVISLLKEKGSYNIFVSPKSVSKMTGQAKSNILSLKSAGFDCRVLADNSLKDFEIRLERSDGR